MPEKVSPKEDIDVPGQITVINSKDKEPEASQLHISWLVPQDGGSTITYFVVEIQRLDENREEICGVGSETIRVEAEAERVLKNRFCPSKSSLENSCRESEDLGYGRYAVVRTKFKHRATISVPWEEGANGLKPASNYQIRIFAGNREGLGLESDWFGGKGHPSLVRTMDETDPKKILGNDTCPVKFGDSCLDTFDSKLAEAI